MKIRTISDELKLQYGQKIYRLSLSSGCTCPNRDGTISYGGCTFCSEGGSGDFAAPKTLPINEQIRYARERVDRKISNKIKAEDRRYIAYFQSFTNTYVRNDEELNRLKTLYIETIKRPEIVILSIGTRPDCLGDEIFKMLCQVHEVAPEKPVWIELGLQTCHDRTAKRIHRGYKLAAFEDAYKKISELNRQLTTQVHEEHEEPFKVILHTILGLPGETREDVLETMRYISCLDPKPAGIKIQLLHILKGTQMANEFEESPFSIYTMEEYCNLVVECLQILPEEVVIHRMTGDGPKSLLMKPKWSADKKRVLNMLNRKIREALL